MENFSELSLVSPLAQAISDLGFVKPSPIQAEALPVLLGDPTDFIGLAATGTGKTAAFSIPLLARLKPDVKAVQALILCPTRELVLQVAGQVNLLGKHLGVHALPIYGGASYGDQFRGLKSGAQVVVGTPGRMIDHLERGTLRLDDVTTVVLDEADEMISMGFREDMEAILSQAPEDTSNVWLFSATMSPGVRRVADDFLENPRTVQVNRTEMLSSTVEQYYYMTQEKNKPEVLCKLIDAADHFYGVVFCQTKDLVMNLSRYLSERGYKVDSLHGDKSQAAREMTLADFRAKRLTVLVCTDVAARGIDVKDITHVINYSIPRELDNYVHRIGRTARSGKSGFAMSLVTPSHRHLLGKIERLTKSRIHEGQVPTRKAIGIKKVSSLLARLQEQENYARAVELLDDAWREALAGMSAEEIAGRFLALTYPDVFAEERRPEMARAERDERPKGGKKFTRGGPTAGRKFEDRPPRKFQRADSEDRPPRKFERADTDAPPRKFQRAEGDAAPAKKFKRAEGEERPHKFKRADGEQPARKKYGKPKPWEHKNNKKSGGNYPPRRKDRH